MTTDKLKIAHLPLNAYFLCSSILVLLWLALAYDLKKSEEITIERARNDVSNLAMAYRENISRTVSAIDEVMIAIAAEHAGHPGEYRIPEWVERSPFLKGLALQVGLIGSDGIVRASNLGVGGRIDVSDRPHFRYHFDPSASQPYISVPVVGRLSGKWSIQFTRRLNRNDGSFDGMVLIAIDPVYLSRFFDDLDLSNNGVAILVGQDGIVRAGRALNDKNLGQNLSDSSLFRNLRVAANGTHIAQSHIDEIQRIFGYASVPHYPLVVGLGLSMNEVLTAYRWQRDIYFVSAGIGSIIIIALTWIIVRESKRRRKQQLTIYAKECLHEQKQQLDTALSNMSQGVLMFDSSERIVVCNRRYIEIYGLSPDVIKPGCTFRELIAHRKESGSFAGGIDQYHSNLRADLARGITTDLIIETPDGRSIQIVNQPIGNGGWVTTHEDITEKCKAAQERDQHREFLNQLIDNVPVAIIVKDARDRRFVHVNRATEALWGISRTDAIGKTPHDLFPKARADLIAADDNRVLQSHLPLFVEQHQSLASTDDGRILTSGKLAIRGNDGEPKYLVSVIEDVTQRTATERQLQQAQKMEAVGNLTGGLAHDFNNLLTIIVGNLDLLREDVVDLPSATQKVETILQASLRGADLTRQMLAFSRRQPLHPKRIDINDLVRNTTGLLQRTLGDDISVELRIAADSCPVLVDEAQMEAAVVNIAINARDAMPSGGTLIIAAAIEHLDADYAAHHSGATPGDYMCVEISDTGAGMPQEVLARIFEPFFTTKAPGEGTGLGLSMVYGFIKQSGGYINVSSEVGKGTTFKLYLPHAVAEEAQSNAEVVTKRPVPLASGEVILAVDDNPDVRATAVNHLKNIGYRVLEADNARTALDKLDSNATIDVLFTDIVMPGGMNGKELANAARAKRPNLKVLFTSGFPGTALTNGAMLDAGNTLLSKPYRKQDLARAVREVLHQQ